MFRLLYKIIIKRCKTLPTGWGLGVVVMTLLCRTNQMLRNLKERKNRRISENERA